MDYDAVSNSKSKTSSNDWMMVNNELERMWKEAIVKSFEGLS